MAEMLNRVIRGGLSQLVLTRVFSTNDWAILAKVIPLMELLSVFQGRAGFNSKLINCSAKEFKSLSITTYYLSWIIAILLFSIQLAIGSTIHLLSIDNQNLGDAIALTSFCYLLFPVFSINIALLYKTNNLVPLAKLNIIVGLGGGVITIVMALLGYGFWSILIPLILNNVLTAIAIPYISPWHINRFSLKGIKNIFNYASGLMLAEGLDKLRSNIDYWIIGIFLGDKEMGIYYFGFTSGINFCLGIINSYYQSFYPNLNQYKGDEDSLKDIYYRDTKRMIRHISKFSIAIAILMPLVIEKISGDKWIEAMPVISIVSISAIPRVLKVSTGALLQLRNKPYVILGWDIGLTLFLVAGVLVAVNKGIVAVSLAVLIVHWVYLPIYFWFVSKRYLR
ncbi:oligosaccharide flippase family protein [Calothrix sp. FACHB-1219]|nr:MULTISPECIES: oligosaccharide flippase family protein [unclassified Calothrix]MBD2201592.1 oligosaccharide flippase family protein [Calothrix sp. FACHB-168]MBD2217278.1 oligosaccharide flippase family protein [Calothrix sp. FACHB-1219]